MANYFDYLEGRGDIPFSVDPFNEVDNVILSELAYINYVGIANDEKKVKLTDACDAYFSHIPENQTEIENPNLLKAKIMKELVKSVRFKNTEVCFYVNDFDPDLDIQFAAVTFLLDDQSAFVAFRGTDHSFTGLHDALDLSYLPETDSQRKAIDYLNTLNRLPNYPLRIGGHSKGGNLAMYAAALLPEELLKNVAHIYDLDGPGFCDEIFDLSALDRIRAKTTCVIPEFSVIGKLFSPEFPDTRIVASDETSVMQHELLSWGVKGKELDTVPENDPRSKNINRIIDEWVENIPLDDRKTFVNELFDALASNKARTMTDIMKNGPDGFEEILLQVVGSSPVTKKTAAKLPEQALFGEKKKNLKITGFWNALSRFGIVQSVIMVIAGLMFIFASDNILNVASMMLITGLALTQLGLTFKRFRESHWKFTMVRDRFHLSIIMIVLSIFMLIKEQSRL